MNFSSDNAYGAAPQILAAIAEANQGAATSYGADPWTARLSTRFADIFAHECAVFPVVTGTAANALALATLVPPHGAIFCHGESHIMADECGAPEFFTHGAKLIPLAGENGKITPAALEAGVAPLRRGDAHSVQPSAVSITQATERGTVYTPAEIAAIADVAKAHGMTLHMDGARFANALVHLDCTPAEATWRAGVEAMSFGATKNGAVFGEAVVFFNPALAADFEYRRMKAGHLLSKMRFISAQLLAYLEGGLWLKLAARANALAARLEQGLRDAPGVRIVNPAEANSVFVAMPIELAARLRKEGAKFYDWSRAADGDVVVRLVASFATPEDDIEKFLALTRH